jgi:hypothetical protein
MMVGDVIVSSREWSASREARIEVREEDSEMEKGVVDSPTGMRVAIVEPGGGIG